MPARTFYLDSYIESWVIKGFSIPVAAIFDETANVEALQELTK
jgi:hypothetical protein